MKKSLIIVASVMMLGVSSVWALGTQAGTVINNSASLTYSAGGVDQTDNGNDAINSNTDTFVVDNKIDMTVSHQDPSIKEVVPGATAQVLTFLVKNTGNKVQDYSLTVTKDDGNPYNETDNFDADNVNVYVESGDHDGYQSDEDTETYIDELAADANTTVYIVADIPSDRVDGDVAEYTLTAQVAEGGSSGSQGADITSDNSNDDDTKGSAAGDEQIVFADGDGNGATDGDKDGKYADYSAYKVVTATLDLKKLSCVITDNVTSDNTKAKRIPGATIAYVFDISNTGHKKADDVIIKDDLVSQLDETAITVQDLETDTDDACTCINGTGNNTTGASSSTPDNTQDNHDVEINIGSVSAGKHSCLEIRVPIK